MLCNGVQAKGENMTVRTALFAAMLAGSVATVISARPAIAADATPAETGHAMKLPETASDHLALASSYEEKVAAWRKEAAYHRDMAATYKKSHPDLKGGVRNAEAVQMEKHCSAIAKDADKLAADAENAANYHRLRAKELQGG